MAAKEGIEHIVVLMLENRSFDCMLGKLNPSGPGFEGITDDLANYYGATRYPVWKSETLDETAACIPNVDPGESFDDMNEQLFGARDKVTEPASMNGFVQNYATLPTSPTQNSDLIDKIEYYLSKPKQIVPGEVMHYFEPEQLPALTTLARAFGVCDQWYASAPCQTWPNRFFAHTGTCLGYVNNQQFPIPFTAPSIFSRLDQNNKAWRVYFHDLPQSILLKDVWATAPLHYRFFHQFLVDAENGALPHYSFIEPRYFPDVLLNKIPNDQHPPHNVLQGDALIAAVYNAVRQSPCWKRTLLIITYDEHGGCFDHAPPPEAVPPDNCAQFGFDFARYGVRVPAVIVSPYMPQGTVVRSVPIGMPQKGPPYPFDHTSILSTLREQFGLGLPLTARDAVAPSLLTALTLQDPVNDGPAHIDSTATPVAPSKFDELISAPLNHLQSALADMIARLPMRLPEATVAITPLDRGAPPAANLSEAATYALSHLRFFLEV